MSKRATGAVDHSLWFVEHIIKYHTRLVCPSDMGVLDVCSRLSLFIISMRDQVTDPIDLDHTTCQLQLFDYLKNEIKAKSRPTEFVHDIANRLFDMLDDKHFTSANVELCYQTLQNKRKTRRSTATAQQRKTPTTSNTTTKKSAAQKTTGLASEMGGRILDSAFADAGPAIQPPGDNYWVEDCNCAAGLMCRAIPPHNTFDAGHKCYVCSGKIHSALLCGMRLDAYMEKYPAFPDNFKCSSGNIIVRGDDANEMRAVCHQCMNQMAHVNPLKQPEEIWVCGKCDTVCAHTKKRCGSCFSWKDGARALKSKSTLPTKRKKTPHYPTKERKAQLSKKPPRELTMNSGQSPSDIDSLVSACTAGTNSSLYDVFGMDSSQFDWGSGKHNEDDILAARSEELVRKLDHDDMNDDGDGGTSDAEGDGFDCVTSFLDGMHEADRERNLTDHNEIEDDAEGEEFACVPDSSFVLTPLIGAPKGWLPPAPPETWTTHQAKTEKGEPEFKDVDNPGNWSAYTFRPTFDLKKRYVHHCMPAGAVPVPVNDKTGKREVGGYEFFYNGWKHPSPSQSNSRMGATRDHIFPQEREVQLDANLLKRLGLTKERMLKCDPFFFYQLLLPVIDPAHSGIEDDPRMGYYEEVATHTNLYAVGKKGMGGTRGHVFRPTNSEELVTWDGIVARNLADNQAESWMASQSNTFDHIIAEAMHYRRFLDIKACMKQCAYFEEKDRKADGYDPTQKYRLVWDVMTYNMNQLIMKGGLDHTMDETTWPNNSYADMHSRLLGKKTNKGGQHVLLLDSRRRYMYAWTPRHKFYPVVPPFTASGPAEVKRMVELIAPLIKGAVQDPSDKRRQIFEEPVHIAMDNFFSGDDVLKYLGEAGFKSTMTARRDRLPKGVPKKHFHHAKGVVVNLRSKVARFEQPIIAVKHVTPPPTSGLKDYTLVHVSFQSTGGTNISTINTLDSVDLYVRERNKGQGNTKRTWGIEMNFGREMYLKTYSAVDKIDQMLLLWNIRYRSWKWWHAPTRHGKAIAMSMAYSLYLQCAEGGVDPDWKVKPVSGPQFRQKMSLQMVQYKSSNQNYPGDEKMRTTTIKPKRIRLSADEMALVDCSDNTKRVSYSQYLDVKQPRGKKTRMCSGDLHLLKQHINSMTKVGAGACQWCGKRTFMRCELCKKRVCLKSGVSATSLSCCLDFHDDTKYGLGMMDRKELFGVGRNNFRKASASEIKKNYHHMKGLMLKYYNDHEKE